MNKTFKIDFDPDYLNILEDCLEEMEAALDFKNSRLIKIFEKEEIKQIPSLLLLLKLGLIEIDWESKSSCEKILLKLSDIKHD